MNIANINDLFEGQEEAEELLITDKLIQDFANVSNDKNPIHISEEYSKKNRFGKQIAHGFLLVSRFSGLFGTKLPGIGSLYKSQNVDFKRPIYIGDNVEIKISIIKIEKNKKTVTFVTQCKVRNKVVIDGIAEIFIP